MYSEADLIARIKAISGYTNVDYAEDTSMDIVTTDYTVPYIFVGHLGIKLKDPQYMFANAYNELENEEILLSSIQFICKRTALATVRTAIRNSYIGYSPYVNDSNYSSVFFVEANVVAKSNTNIWWQEIIGLLMPRIS